MSAALLLIALAATGDAPSPVRVVDSSRELGTSYEVVLVVSPEHVERAHADLAEARALCRSLEARLSEWQQSSDISRVNRDAARAPVPVSHDLVRIIEGSRHVWRVTRGAFDPTWHALAPLWAEAAAEDAWPDSVTVRAARAHVDLSRVALEGESVRFLDPGVSLGIAGVAKGWIIDAVFLYLRGLGHADVLVNIGGDARVAGVAAGGAKNVFTILDPYDPTRAALEMPVGDTAIATSGVTFRARTIEGRRAGHILDPRTGYPPGFDGSVTVLTRDAAMADALATGLFVLGPEAGLALADSLPGVDALFVTRTGIRATFPIEMHAPDGAPR